MLHRLFKRQAEAPAPVADPDPIPDLNALHDAHEERLRRVNSALRQMGSGPLIGVPLCPSACQTGPMATFLLKIGADPFDRWNMMYFASDAQTATLLDTERYRPEFDRLYDVDVTDVIGRIAIAWDAFRERYPGATPAETETFKAGLCDMLSNMAAELESLIYPGRSNKWTTFFELGAAAQG